MIDKALFARGIKANYRLFLLFAAIMTMYVVIIIMMFDPELGDALDEMVKAMPELMAAFGMVDAGNTLITFMASYLYGFIMSVLPLIFVIVLAIRLVTAYVDKGAMAYLLTTPNRRTKIMTTQITVMLVWLTALYAWTFAMGAVSAELLFPGALDHGRYLLLNINTFTFMYAMSGISFAAACAFDETRKAVLAAAAITVGSYLIQMLVSLDERLSWLRYFTIYTLFPCTDIASGAISGSVQSLVLFGLGSLLFIGGSVIFSRRDLSI